MKTIVRVVIILVAATLIGGLLYAGVSASSTATGLQSFDGGERQEFGEGSGFRPEGGEFRPDGEGGDRDGFGFPGGVIKAVVLMSLAGGVYSGIVWAGKKAKRAVTA